MPPAVLDRDAFLKHLRQSGLVSSRDFRRIIDRSQDQSKPRIIARMLVDAGLVTKFQAELLLVGRSQGFFLGPYKILDQLGQGGMGRVYKALHQNMNRVVALKVLAPHLVKTPKAQRLFQREVQAAAQLNHSNIVTAYDANEVSGRHFLAMEYVDGPNLEQLVREQGPLPVGLACEIIRQAANGLEHARELGLVHHDIKPANLLVQRSKNLQSFVVKILDFGLARLAESDLDGDPAPGGKREHTVMGTPDFLSPEQARNEQRIDVRSDLYSLGCTFYYLLTGRTPFPGGTTLEKLIRHSSEPPVAVGLFRDDVPAPALEIMQKLMAKKPDDRFQTPQDAALALAPFAVAAAPTWDLHAHADQPTMTPAGGAEPAPEDMPKLALELSAAASPLSELAGTLPTGLAPTPLSPTSDELIVSIGEQHTDRHLARNALLWAVAIVTGLAALIAGGFFWLRS